MRQEGPSGEKLATWGVTHLGEKMCVVLTELFETGGGSDRVRGGLIQPAALFFALIIRLPGAAIHVIMAGVWRRHCRKS